LSCTSSQCVARYSLDALCALAFSYLAVFVPPSTRAPFPACLAAPPLSPPTRTPEGRGDDACAFLCLTTRQGGRPAAGGEVSQYGCRFAPLACPRALKSACSSSFGEWCASGSPSPWPWLLLWRDQAPARPRGRRRRLHPAVGRPVALQGAAPPARPRGSPQSNSFMPQPTPLPACLMRGSLKRHSSRLMRRILTTPQLQIASTLP